MKNELLKEDAKRRYSEIPKDTFRAIEAAYSKGHPIYAPKERADSLAITDSAVSFEPRGVFDGPLRPTELRAVLFVHNEIRGLVRMAIYEDNMSGAGLMLGGVEDHFMIVERLRGMADFVRNISKVAKIREILFAGKVQPGRSRDVGRIVSFWHKSFSQVLEEDGFLLGDGVIDRLVEITLGIDSLAVINDREMLRWSHYALGVKLAGDLYLEALVGASARNQK